MLQYVMQYAPLPGPAPERPPFGALPLEAAESGHPFLPAESVPISALRTYSVCGVSTPRVILDPWLQTEAGIRLMEPGRVQAAGDEFLKIITEGSNADIVGRAAMALCYTPANQELATRTPLNPRVINATLLNLAQLLSGEIVTLHKGDKTETAVLALATILARDEDPLYFLYLSPPKTGLSPQQ